MTIWAWLKPNRVAFFLGRRGKGLILLCVGWLIRRKRFFHKEYIYILQELITRSKLCTVEDRILPCFFHSANKEFTAKAASSTPDVDTFCILRVTKEASTVVLQTSSASWDLSSEVVCQENFPTNICQQAIILHLVFRLTVSHSKTWAGVRHYWSYYWETLDFTVGTALGHSIT